MVRSGEKEKSESKDEQEGLICAGSFKSSKEFGPYLMCNGQLLEAFNQGSEII